MSCGVAVVLRPALGIRVCINATSFSIRNVSIVLAGHASRDTAANPFHPEFLALTTGFTVVRFEQWMKVTGGDNNAARSWASRVMPWQLQTSQQVSGLPPSCLVYRARCVGWVVDACLRGALLVPQGVAVEYMIQLCNIAKLSPWFVLPQLGDSSYHVGLITALLDTLDADLNVTIEYAHGTRYNQVCGVCDRW